ncbi:MAG: transposase [Actinomycetia bacterium]|nr:transposase [Actinomycetes bacterium]
MIKRKKYTQEFKRKIAQELIMEIASAAEISKREGISPTAIYKWRDMYTTADYNTDEQEIVELKKRIRDLEETVSELALDNHILKKTEKILKQLKKQEKLSGSISPRNLE